MNVSLPENQKNTLICLFILKQKLLHGLFVMEDKLSMAHGLETRVPFMDIDLVDFAMACQLRLN